MMRKREKREQKKQERGRSYWKIEKEGFNNK